MRHIALARFSIHWIPEWLLSREYRHFSWDTLRLERRSSPPLTRPPFESSQEGLQADGRLPERHSEWRITLRPFVIAADRWAPSL